MEDWRDVIGYEGLYQVSSYGRVKHLPHIHHRSKSFVVAESICTMHKQNMGYYVVDLYKENKRKTKLVHRLVAEAFVSNPGGLKVVNHIDSNRANNHISNLEWCTHSHNAKWSYDTNNRREKMNWKRGKYHYKSKPVFMLNKKGIKLQRFDSIIDAENATGVNNSLIVACLKKRNKTAGGYIWEYAE